MKVLKRNGRTEELDVSKIKKYTSEAVAGLANVSLSELEVDAKIQFTTTCANTYKRAKKRAVSSRD